MLLFSKEQNFKGSNMKTLFMALTLLFLLSTITFAKDITIGDCESIEMESMGSSLWCDGGEVLGD